MCCNHGRWVGARIEEREIDGAVLELLEGAESGDDTLHRPSGRTKKTDLTSSWKIPCERTGVEVAFDSGRRPSGSIREIDFAGQERDGERTEVPDVQR